MTTDDLSTQNKNTTQPCLGLAGMISADACRELSERYQSPLVFKAQAAGAAGGGVFLGSDGNAVIHIRHARADHTRGDVELTLLHRQALRCGDVVRAVILGLGSGRTPAGEAPDLACLADVCAQPGIDRVYVLNFNRLGRSRARVREVLSQLADADVSVVSAGKMRSPTDPAASRNDASTLQSTLSSDSD